MITIENLISQAEDLHPPEPSVVRLAQVVSSDTNTPASIAEAIQFDQVLTAHVLRLANSAMSASVRTVSTVKDAIIRLGGSRILEFLMARHLKPMAKKPLLHYGYAEYDLWRHSVAAACAAELLAKFSYSATNGVAFSAALLHDIGKVLLVNAGGPEEMNAVWRLMNRGIISCEKAEQIVFGFSHADIGAQLAEVWHMPTEIVQAIRDHHKADYAENIVTDTVHIANIAARSIGEGIGNEGMGVLADPVVADRIGLTHEKFEQLCAETSIKFKEVIQSCGF